MSSSPICEEVYSASNALGAAVDVAKQTDLSALSERSLHYLDQAVELILQQATELARLALSHELVYGRGEI